MTFDRRDEADVGIVAADHTTGDEGLDKNFAGMFPFIDLAFDTFYMPPGRRPERFGIGGNPRARWVGGAADVSVQQSRAGRDVGDACSPSW